MTTNNLAKNANLSTTNNSLSSSPVSSVKSFATKEPIINFTHRPKMTIDE